MSQQRSHMASKPPQTNPTELLERQLFVLTELYRLQSKQQEEQRVLLEKLNASVAYLNNEVKSTNGSLGVTQGAPVASSVKVSDVDISFWSIFIFVVKWTFASILLMIPLWILGLILSLVF